MSPAVRASAPAESRPPDFREPGSAPRWRVGLGAVVIVVLVLIGVGVVLSAVASARESMSTTDSGGSSSVVDFATGSVGTSTPAGRSVFVHLLGRVAHPGLYEVEAGSRAVDVVTAAGGFAAEADESALNLARPVTDGEQIVVPKVGENPPSPPAAPGPTGAGAAAGSGGVDLNSADQATLETLSGVGPATAAAILAWRDEHGRFESVEDLLDVSGIGEKKLAAMRDSVTVG